MVYITFSLQLVLSDAVCFKAKLQQDGDDLAPNR